jgi:hypothetical protein
MCQVLGHQSFMLFAVACGLLQVGISTSASTSTSSQYLGRLEQV